MADNTEPKVTTVNGVRAVELFYRIIRDISSGNCAFYQSQTRLNTPGMGTLMPENFRDTAEITTQCIRLFELEYVQTLEAINKFIEREILFQWVSVYMPVKFLLQHEADKRIYDLATRFKVTPSKLCFALPVKLLNEENPVVSAAIKALRNHGFHFMLTDFGSAGCPLMKLSDYEVDYVVLSTEVTGYLGKSERSDSAVKSLIDFVRGLDVEPIADGVTGSAQAEKLYEFECMYCAGPLSGKYVAERYVRRRSDQLVEQENGEGQKEE